MQTHTQSGQLFTHLRSALLCCFAGVNSTFMYVYICQRTWNDGMPAGWGLLARTDPGDPPVLCCFRPTGGVKGLLLVLAYI